MNPSQLQELNSILEACLGMDNAVRQQAEQAISAHLKGSADPFVFGLVHLLRFSSVPQVRSLCAIILRRKIPKGKPLLYEQLNGELQARLKSELLAGMLTEPERHVRAQISEAVAEIAEILLHKNGWPELFPFLLQSAASGTAAELRVLALQIIGNISDECPEAIDPFALNIHQLYGAALTDGSPNVRIAGAVAACQTFTAVDPQHNKQFQTLVPRVCDTLSALAQSEETEDMAMKLLGALADAFQENASFFRPHLTNISQLLGSIGAADNVADGVRQVCVECLILAAESCPGMVRKLPVFLQNTVQATIALMLSFEEDPNWGAVRTVDDDMIDNSNFGCGEMAIDRFSVAIRGDKLRPILLPLLMSFLQNSNWRYQYVALMALGQVAEVLEVSNLPMVELLPFLTNPHPRLRYAVLECIGQMAQDFQPEFQQQFHKIIPRLLPAVTDGNHPRVQRHAAGAIFSMVEALTPEDGIVQKYAAQIFQAMAPLLQQADVFVKEQVVSALGAVCVAAPESLVNIYDSFMTAMKGLLQSATGREQSALRGRVMECMAFVGSAAGKERFSKDAHEIMTFYMHLLQQGLPPDDVCIPYMLRSWPQLCQILESEFSRYLPLVMPLVLQAASKQEHWESTTVDTGLGDTELRIQSKALTSSIAEKADACCILCSFAHELKTDYYPFLADTFQCAKPLMQFYINDEVRSYAISLMPLLLEVAIDAQKRSVMPQSAVAAFYRDIVTAQLACLPKEPDHELLMSLVSSLEATLESGQSLGQLLDEAALLVVAEALFKLLGASLQRMKEREDSKADPDYDEDSEARVKGDNMAEDELNFAVAECVGSLMKLHKQTFAPAFAALVPQIEALLGGTFGSTKIALFIIDDFVQYCGEPACAFYPKLVPLLLGFATHVRPEIRQAAAFGLGLCAEFGSPSAVSPFLPSIIHTMQSQAAAPQAREEANASPTDNMISTLLKIARHQQRPDLLPIWCMLLPLLADEGEAEINHNQLCDFLIEGRFEGSYFAHAVRCLVNIATGAVQNLQTSEGLSKKIVHVVKTLRERQDVKQLLSSLPHGQQQALIKVLR